MHPRSEFPMGAGNQPNSTSNQSNTQSMMPNEWERPQSLGGHAPNSFYQFPPQSSDLFSEGPNFSFNPFSPIMPPNYPPSMQMFYGNNFPPSMSMQSPIGMPPMRPPSFMNPNFRNENPSQNSQPKPQNSNPSESPRNPALISGQQNSPPQQLLNPPNQPSN